MAKLASSGDYSIFIEDSGKVTVFRFYDNVKGALREIAELKGFEYNPDWNTRQFGANIIKAFGEGNSAVVGEYAITKLDSGSIKVYRVYDNTKGALREIAENIGFQYDPNWTTRQFGTKLVAALNS